MFFMLCIRLRYVWKHGWEGFLRCIARFMRLLLCNIPFAVCIEFIRKKHPFFCLGSVSELFCSWNQNACGRVRLPRFHNKVNFWPKLGAILCMCVFRFFHPISELASRAESKARWSFGPLSISTQKRTSVPREGWLQGFFISGRAVSLLECDPNRRWMDKKCATLICWGKT